MVSLKLKLVIDKRQNQVLFAEVGKDFVDFIFHILSLPLATVTRVLSKSDETGSAVPGCIRSLYEAVKVLDGRYIGQTSRECLLNSKAPYRGAASLGLLAEATFPSVRNTYEYVKNSSCKPSCGVCGDEGGYVIGKEVLFMVTDDLAVKPMSAVSALSLIGPNDNFSSFKNKEVDFGPEKALKLLKASLQSKTVLTDVFLNDVAVIEKGVKNLYRKKIVSKKKKRV